MTGYRVLFVLYLFSMLLGCESTDQNSIITILVVGRGGADASSTVRELIGPRTSCKIPNNTFSIYNHNLIREYTLKVNSSSEGQYTIKLVEIPELVDGKTLEEDAETLARLKSFIQANGVPDYLLAVSRFDDKNFDTQYSPFVQLLKRIELLRTLNFLNEAVDPVFLFTKLMSERRTIQRKPESKLNDFRQVMQTHTSFSQPLTLVAGENYAGSEYNVNVEKTYYKLPNTELYPKNVWERFITVSSSEDETKIQILTLVMNNRELGMSCNARLVAEQAHDDMDDFMYLLQQPDISVQETQVNTKIQEEFNKSSPRKRVANSVHKRALQIKLQNMNFTRVQELPRNVADRALLFQENLFGSSFYTTILSKAFGLKPPEYDKPITVGFGFDILRDELTFESPFRTDNLRISDVGYALPNFMKCKKYFGSDENFQVYSQNYSEYVSQRFKYLDHGESLADMKFAGKIREGFNIKPNKSDGPVTLSAVQEIRVVKCVVDPQNLNFSDEFLNAVNSMTEFTASDRDSVNEWVVFFDRFGSHVVTQAYGGGSLRGFLSLTGRNIMFAKSKTHVHGILNGIVEFSNFSSSNLGSPFYRFNGGVPNYRMEGLYDLSSNMREYLFNEWVDTLSSKFVMLTYELDLLPISEVVRSVDEEKGEFAQNAMELLLRGDLKYSRKRNNSPRNTSRVKTARRYVPASFKDIIKRMNNTMESHNAEFEAQTNLMRLNNHGVELQDKLAAKRRADCEHRLGHVFGKLLCDGVWRGQ